jgi:hypothetical protein
MHTCISFVSFTRTTCSRHLLSAGCDFALRTPFLLTAYCLPSHHHDHHDHYNYNYNYNSNPMDGPAVDKIVRTYPPQLIHPLLYWSSSLAAHTLTTPLLEHILYSSISQSTSWLQSYGRVPQSCSTTSTTTFYCLSTLCGSTAVYTCCIYGASGLYQSVRTYVSM